jgi:hypothetical protein
MTSRADFRQYALDCMREAESAGNSTMRLTMFGLARIWMGVAVEVDQHVMQPDDQPRETTTATAASADSNPVWLKE